MQSAKEHERYQRQLLLPHFGQEGQERLYAASVLVIGAGGLGCPVLLYLAAAGIGKLGIIDFDRVDISNLHRQVLYTSEDVGQPKAEVAAQKIRKAYPDTTVEAYNARMETHNALEIISGYDLVVDGSDNFPTRYLVDDACLLLGKPLVYGSVYRFEGQVAVFNYAPAGGEKTSYRDLFPNPPAPEEIPNCAEAGVLGVLPGIIGSLQANEAIKLACGIGEPLANRLLTFNALSNSFFEFALSPNPAAQSMVPKSEQEFKAMHYAHFCGHKQQAVTEIDAAVFERLSGEKDAMMVDVRNEWEQPRMEGGSVINLPLPQLEERLQELESTPQLLVFCQAGARSLQAAQIIQSRYPEKKVYSLKGGITQWNAYQNEKAKSHENA